jgi:MOSC domain-containing protein YiiM
MSKGSVVFIYTGEAAKEPLVSVSEAHAVPGRGLAGDRYFNQTGSFWKPLPDYELTLIEIEAIEDLKRDFGIEFSPGDGRRNIVTRGVSLNDLVGQEFQVGEVTLRGIRLCEPCKHLARLSHRAVVRGLVHKGGLRAQILTDGTIRVGDVVIVNRES